MSVYFKGFFLLFIFITLSFLNLAYKGEFFSLFTAENKAFSSFFRKKLHTRHFCEVHIGVEFFKGVSAGIRSMSAL